ncbi:MAG: hypothetical protein Q8R08_00485, partial [bacterium]|nr:hypothetical protein [bacterium]
SLTATPILSVTSFNQNQNKDATSVPARPQDIIVFTMTAENQSDKIIPGYIVEANISEVTDKSTLTDAQGASYNSATNSLIWTPLDIPAKGSIQKQFTVRVNQISANSSNPVMRIKFNNEVTVSVVEPTISPAVLGASQTPRPAPAPSAAYKAPVTGPAGDLSVWLALIATGTYFILRKYRIRVGDN